MNIKTQISELLRKLHLLHLTDSARFYFTYLSRFANIKQVQRKYPSFVFPPPYAIFETYHLDYEDYYQDGKQTATEIINYVNPFLLSNSQPLSILDWGCGPARVIRHIPELFPTWKAYGSDYNSEYIAWCKANIAQVEFIQNQTTPPIPLNDAVLDVVYGLSIITHLSASNHTAWVNEFHRLLKPNGLLLITSQGDYFKKKLLPTELVLYNRGELVVRTTNNEGNRSYSAFQPVPYMRSLFSAFEVLDFIPGGSPTSIHGEQDTWLVRKK